MDTSIYAPLPNQRFSIIYADPPWAYREVINKQGKDTSAADWHYPTLTMDELKALPVADIAADDCLLFLWVSSPNLLDCIKVGEHWGFKFKQVPFVWDKQRTVVGHYTLTQCELCLVFKRGKIPKPRGKTNVRQLQSIPREKHSKKPDRIRQLIGLMFPTQSKIELFARNTADSWYSWGNEV